MSMQSLRFFWRVGLIICLAFSLLACQAGMSSDMAGEKSIPGAQWVGTYVDGQGKTGIRGRVVLKDEGTPLGGSYINIYPDTISNLLGPSQFISTPTDSSGFYEMEVPAGVYYVVGRKRLSGQSTGPLSPGDYYSEHQRLVTRVETGKFVEIELPVVVMKAPMFFKNRVVSKETDTGISGVLIDQAGKPVMGGFAMAYSDKEMKRLPDYASTLSDEEGRFTIYLPEGSRYYLAARIHAWDMPTPGEPYGKYGGENPVLLDVATGSFVKDVQIVMTPFTGTYKPGKSQRPF
ncbi:MAG: hypothetical protein KAU27_00010 [Desulfuromonadales bacterium]|nr:hypothetical protein [Desulfuromonadales bacterium]